MSRNYQITLKIPFKPHDLNCPWRKETGRSLQYNNLNNILKRNLEFERNHSANSSLVEPTKDKIGERVPIHWTGGLYNWITTKLGTGGLGQAVDILTLKEFKSGRHRVEGMFYVS